jgi:glucokinase
LRVLAGDIGGTKTRLGVFEIGESGLRTLEVRLYSSEKAEGLEEIVAEFMAGRTTGWSAACFGIAGPVTDRRVRTTNLPWVVDAGNLERVTGISGVILLNDLEATAWGVTRLEEDQLHVLNPGRSDACGNGAVIAAGTGLGEAGIHRNGDAMRPFACEGGHASFSPTDELGDGLLRALRPRFGHVSWERVLSGSGLANLYRYLLSVDGLEEPEWFVEAERAGDPTPKITAAGLGGSCAVCARTLELFARLYGEEAANLALKMMATGGVWVGGGIAPRIVPVLAGGAFMRGFLTKGRMNPLLESMPVKIVLDDRAALFGAAACAAAAVS